MQPISPRSTRNSTLFYAGVETGNHDTHEQRPRVRACGTEPEAPAHHILQRFEVLDRLGSGAMGSVYRAWDPQLEREVAIKVIACASGHTPAVLSPNDTVDLRGHGSAGGGDELREARIMARLSHPNVLPVFEVGLAGSDVFVVMERVAGVDLRTWLAAPRSLDAVCEVFAQAARGLAAAHAEGVVHRDFKPENILIGNDHRVRVADFGLSDLSSSPSPLLRVEQPVGGTPFYMAPELWRGEPATAHSDVYALCTALAEALCAPQVGAEIDPRNHDRAELDRALRACGCDHRLRAAILEGLADDPLVRPPIGELIGALTPLTPPREPRRWRLLTGAAAAAIVTGVLGALATTAAEPPCIAEQMELAGVWDAARTAALTEAGIDQSLDHYRQQLDAARRGICAAQRTGELTTAQARGRTSCLERRGFELDALATVLVGERVEPNTARAAIGRIAPPVECNDIISTPLPTDKAAVRALYTRLIEAEGNAFGTIGDPRRNEVLIELERSATALGERELQARAAVSLGKRQTETDELDAADASFARGYEQAVTLRAIDVAVTALTQRAIAAAARARGEEARSYGRLALELADKPDAPILRRLQLYYALARVETYRGDSEAAFAMTEKGLALTEHTSDPKRELNLRWLQIRALRDRDGDPMRQIELARQNVELARKIFGEDHSDYGIGLNVLAVALRDADRPVEALGYRRRALAVMQRKLPPEHSAVLFQREGVALDLYATGQFEAAAAEARAIHALADKHPAMQNWRGERRADLGALVFATGRIAEGLQLFEDGVAELVHEQSHDHPNALAYRVQYLELQTEAGRVAEAARLAAAIERSYRVPRTTEQQLLLRSDRMRFERRSLADLDLARGRPHAAETRARNALATWQARGGDDADREALYRILGASLTDQRRPAEALEALALAAQLAASRWQLGDHTAWIDAERARALAAQGNHAEALAVARRARGVLERFPGMLRARATAETVLAGSERAQRAAVSATSGLRTLRSVRTIRTPR